MSDNVEILQIDQSKPPPPPPILVQFPSSKYGSNKQATPIRCQTSGPKFVPTDATWAIEYPELQKACFFARICLHRPPKEWKLKNISGILQEGIYI